MVENVVGDAGKQAIALLLFSQLPSCKRSRSCPYFLPLAAYKALKVSLCASSLSSLFSPFPLRPIPVLLIPPHPTLTLDRDGSRR